MGDLPRSGKRPLPVGIVKHLSQSTFPVDQVNVSVVNEATESIGNRHHTQLAQQKRMSCRGHWRGDAPPPRIC